MIDSLILFLFIVFRSAFSFSISAVTFYLYKILHKCKMEGYRTSIYNYIIIKLITLIIMTLSLIVYSFSWITPLTRIIPKIYKLISRSFIIHFVLFLHIADTTACRIVEFLGICINDIAVLLCCLV